MKTNIRLSVLTLHRRRPGAVVEDGELSEHFARSHRAQLHPLLRHLHLPLWARESHTQQDRERERENKDRQSQLVFLFSDSEFWLIQKQPREGQVHCGKCRLFNRLYSNLPDSADSHSCCSAVRAL